MSAVTHSCRPYTPLAQTLKPLHPFCNTCGWRKGGIDSWDGRRCKCGHSALPMQLDAEMEERAGFFVNRVPSQGGSP